MEHISAKSITGPIRISIPATVAADIKSLKSSFQKIAEKLGCGACFSGANCFFQLERDYFIDEKINVQPFRRFDADPNGAPAFAGEKTLRVGLSSKAGYNFNTITAAIEQIAEKLGHPGCATGCNVFFEHFREDLAYLVNEKGLQQF